MNFKLPGGQTLAVDDLDMTLSTLMDTARRILDDDKITPENLGVDKHFFFVNCSTGTLLDDSLAESFPLRTLRWQVGQEIELCLA